MIQNHQILLALRSSQLSDGNQWGLIGGKIEADEAIHQALIREMYEETGLIISANDMTLMHVISFKKSDGAEYISFDFLITSCNGVVENKEPSKHIALAWFALESLPDNIIPRHKEALEKYTNGSYYSHIGYL